MVFSNFCQNIGTTDFHAIIKKECQCHLKTDGKFVHSIGQVNNTFINFFIITVKFNPRLAVLKIFMIFKVYCS